MRRYRARQTSYASPGDGGLDAHPAGSPGTDAARAAPRCAGDRGDGWRAIVFALLCLGVRDRVLRLPDLPDLRLLLLAAVGARAPARPHAGRSTASATRPSIRWRSPRARCCRSSASVGDRLWIALILASFLALVAGVYRLGRLAATPLVGAVAGALLLTRFDYPFLAARGYIDIPYMALVVWAAVLEAQRAAARRAGASCCSRCAGLLRPEAWLLAALYWCWMRLAARPGASASCTPRSRRSGRWCGRGRLRSSPATRCSRCTTRAPRPRTSGRQLPLSQLPRAIPGFFEDLVKLPVLAAAVLGLAARRRASRRGGWLMPLALLVAGHRHVRRCSASPARR